MPTTSSSTPPAASSIPPALRRYAGLDKRVVLVGQGQKLELWDEAKWQAQIAQTITFPGRLAAPDSRA